MRTVFKFPIPSAVPSEGATIGPFKLPMHTGAKPVRVGLDVSGQPCVWAEVESDNPIEDRMFYLVGTGYPLPDTVGECLGGYTISEDVGIPGVRSGIVNFVYSML